MKAPDPFFQVIVLLALLAPAYAQPAEEERLRMRPGTLTEETLLANYRQANAVAILPEGMNNLNGSFTIVHQAGSYHLALLQQAFTGGYVKLQQSGETNQYRGTISGTQIEISILQQGGFNTIDQQVTGDRLQYTLIQEGSNNTIQHQAEPSGIPMQIHQRGSDMRLIIRSNH